MVGVKRHGKACLAAKSARLGRGCRWACGGEEGAAASGRRPTCWKPSQTGVPSIGRLVGGQAVAWVAGARALSLGQRESADRVPRASRRRPPSDRPGSPPCRPAALHGGPADIGDGWEAVERAEARVAVGGSAVLTARHTATSPALIARSRGATMSPKSADGRLRPWKARAGAARRAPFSTAADRGPGGNLWVGGNANSSAMSHQRGRACGSTARRCPPPPTRTNSASRSENVCLAATAAPSCGCSRTNTPLVCHMSSEAQCYRSGGRESSARVWQVEGAQ